MKNSSLRAVQDDVYLHLDTNSNLGLLKSSLTSQIDAWIMSEITASMKQPWFHSFKSKFILFTSKPTLVYSGCYPVSLTSAGACFNLSQNNI